MLEFNAGINCVAGVQIGEKKIRIALSDLDGHIVEQMESLHTSNRDAVGVVRQVSAEIAGLMQHAGHSRSSLVAIGLAIPGIVDFDRGVVIRAVNMPGWVESQSRT